MIVILKTLSCALKEKSSLSWSRLLPLIPTRNLRTIKRRHRREQNPAPSFPEDDLPNIAVIGRPNVGKSTFYNSLTSTTARKNTRAIVHQLPGVTRDSLKGPGVLSDLEFNLIDTAGIEGFIVKTVKKSLTKHEQKSASVAGMGARTHNHVYKILYEDLLKKTIESVMNADGIIFMVDAKEGFTIADEEITKWIKKNISVPTMLVANKCDNRTAERNLMDFDYLYGFYDEIIEISAVQKEGYAGLYLGMRKMLEEIYTRRYGSLQAPAPKEETNAIQIVDWKPSIHDDEFEYNKLRNDNPIIVSVIGKPNAGKSTLINGMLSKNLLLTGPAPGVTRDSKPVEWSWKDQRFRLVDTAGLRRRKAIESAIEQLCAIESIRSLKMSHVVVVVIDGQEPLSKQDMVLLGRAVDEGRGVVLVINKLDLVDRFRQKHSLNELKKFVRKNFSLGDFPIIETSAIKLDEAKRQELCEAIIKVNQGWNRYCAPKLLTDWFIDFKGLYKVPRVKGRIPILKKMTQVKARPPTFQVITNLRCGDVFGRTMMNKLREEFDFAGVPLRLRFVVKYGSLKVRKRIGKEIISVEPQKGDDEPTEVREVVG